ncbi:YqjF family protein [Flavobacterium sp. 3HN19-14]|uniref:YqjF family protein n=1 Tax=Flavobacterium sp. 3HN19-14 TaxID=3448133 RepID=UPI003EE36B68
MSFLKAGWKNLALINYEINPQVLKKYVPFGTEIDFWNGKCYVSLVGFLFHDTRVIGLAVPFHTDFEEVNLRFYVKRFENGKWKRGVVFIKEIVPKRAIALIANLLFKEHYYTMKMSNSYVETAHSHTFTYNWFSKKHRNFIEVETKKEPSPILPNSEAEFITEHYFGYTKFTESKTFEYEVTHPGWRQYEVIRFDMDVHFEYNYGPISTSSKI